MIDYHKILVDKIPNMHAVDISLFNATIECLIKEYIGCSFSIDANLPGATLGLLEIIGAMVVEKQVLREIKQEHGVPMKEILSEARQSFEVIGI